MKKIDIFQELIIQDCVPAIIRGLYQNSIIFSHKPAEFVTSEAHLAKFLILSLLEKRTDISKIRSLLEEIVHDTPSISFIVEIVCECHRQNNTNIRQQIDLRMLRSLASKRLDQFYVKDNHDIFAELPESDRIFVLHQWGSDWGTFEDGNRSVVHDYVMRLINNTPIYLGCLLESYLDKHHEYHHRSFSFEIFSKIYNCKDIFDRLESFGDHAFSSLESQQAAELFRQRYTNSESRDTGGQAHVSETD